MMENKDKNLLIIGAVIGATLVLMSFTVVMFFNGNSGHELPIFQEPKPPIAIPKPQKLCMEFCNKKNMTFSSAYKFVGTGIDCFCLEEVDCAGEICEVDTRHFQIAKKFEG